GMSAGTPGGAGYRPARCSRSARFTPAKRTATRTCPSGTSGASTSRTSRTSGPPGSRITTPRIVVIDRRSVAPSLCHGRREHAPPDEVLDLLRVRIGRLARRLGRRVPADRGLDLHLLERVE